MRHFVRGLCILILLSIAPTAFAHTISRIALVWLCPATGFVHSTCNNSITNNPPSDHQLQEQCKFQRGGHILGNENDLFTGLNGDTNHVVPFNAVGLENNYYCLHDSGLFKSFAGSNLSGQDVGGSSSDCETYNSGGPPN